MARYRSLLASVPLALVAIVSPLHAQDDPGRWLERCREAGWPRGEAHCEVRELRLPAEGRLRVDGSPNGGITVRGWDRNEVLVRAKVRAHAPELDEARTLASEVEVEVEAGRGLVRSAGPSVRGNRGWSVSYDVWVPRRTDLHLESVNGGLDVSDVSGRLVMEATNGGIELANVSGDVRGQTVNGGLAVRLDGATWQGEGLELETTNGGIAVEMPSDYSARLMASTVHGGLQTDFPITMQGRIGRRVEAELGRGGPPIRLSTVNGGIELRRR